MYIPLTLVTLVISIGMPAWMWRRLKNMPSLKWIPNTKVLVFAPQGVWDPRELVSSHGLIFDEFNDNGRSFKIVILMYGHLLALTASALPTDSVGCHVLVMMMFLIYAYARPMRWPILNWTRCTTLLLQAIQLLMSFLEVRGTPEQVVTILIMISCLVEALVGAACALRGWMLNDVLHGVIAPLIIDEEGDFGGMSLITGLINGNQGGFSDLEMSEWPPAPPKLAVFDDDAAPEVAAVRPRAPTLALLIDDDGPVNYPRKAMTSFAKVTPTLFGANDRKRSQTIVTEEPVVHGYDGDIMTSSVTLRKASGKGTGSLPCHPRGHYDVP